MNSHKNARLTIEGRKLFIVNALLYGKQGHQDADGQRYHVGLEDRRGDFEPLDCGQPIETSQLVSCRKNTFRQTLDFPQDRIGGCDPAERGGVRVVPLHE